MTAPVLFRGAGLSFTIRIVGVAIALVTQIALARALSTENYGNYAYTVQLAGLLAVIGSLGFSQAAVRVIPAANIDHDSARRLAFIRCGVVVSLLVLSLLAGLALFVGHLGFGGAGLEEPFRTALLPVSVLLMTALTLLRLGQEIMRGDRKIVAAQIGEQVILPLGLLALAGAVLALGSELRAPFVLAFQTTLTGLLAVALIVLALQRYPGAGASSFRRTASEEGLANWVGIGLPLAAAGLMSGFLARGDLVVLGFVAEPEEIALYAAAARVAGLMIFGLAAVNTIAAPLFRELSYGGDRVALQARIDTAAALAVLTAVPVFAVLMLLPGTVLGFFGPDFVTAAPVLQLLAAGNLINVLAGPTGPLMVVTGRQGAYAKLTLLGIVVSVVAILALERLFGLTGAALGSTTGVILLNGAIARYLNRHEGLRSVATPGGLRALAGQIVEWLKRRDSQG